MSTAPVEPDHADAADSATCPAAADLQREIAKYEAACGCEVGSVFMWCALATFVGAVAFTDTATSWSVTGTIIRGSAWVISWSVVGKLLGLAGAHLRAHRLRHKLRRTLAAQANPALAQA